MSYEDFVLLSVNLPLDQGRFMSAWYFPWVLSLSLFSVHLHALKILLFAFKLINHLMIMYIICLVIQQHGQAEVLGRWGNLHISSLVFSVWMWGCRASILSTECGWVWVRYWCHHAWHPAGLPYFLEGCLCIRKNREQEKLSPPMLVLGSSDSCFRCSAA